MLKGELVLLLMMEVQMNYLILHSHFVHLDLHIHHHQLQQNMLLHLE
tara:strand:- start:109 stop:249 length:141 start_codon:yes stop_codon:yes gene_type:complete